MVQEKEEKKINRIYSNNMLIDSDLFKLEVQMMQKNMAINSKKPVIENIEHCHFYRTFDSNGRQTNRCNYVGGHTHEIKVITDKEGNLKAKCSTPIGTVLSSDQHTHNIRYIKSDKVEKRLISSEAQQVIANFERI